MRFLNGLQADFNPFLIEPRFVMSDPNPDPVHSQLHAEHRHDSTDHAGWMHAVICWRAENRVMLDALERLRAHIIEEEDDLMEHEEDIVAHEARLVRHEANLAAKERGASDAEPDRFAEEHQRLAARHHAANQRHQHLEESHRTMSRELQRLVAALGMSQPARSG
ncbi:MAG TPA: hypothetical protein VGN42_09930 [Pirellulales bacterium]|nr:hypothetical protein [Pirellulales bacterium]